MDKLKLHTPDLTASNIEKLAELFPGCVTEARDENGRLIRAVDFDQLRQELSGSIVDGTQERYHLDWPGKREAMLAANAPVAKTLRPCREESVHFDETKNLFIEGDNLDALKLLGETYLNKVKMIYIDPPYNTGRDFIYEDNFSTDTSVYFRQSNQTDESGNRMVANTEANGRFHSAWLTMIYPRLKLARNLLTEDGVICVSVDDGENANVQRLCDEIFGDQNFVVSIIWQKRVSPANDAKWFSSDHDYVIVYAKQKSAWQPQRLDRNDAQLSYYKNPDMDARGPWNSATYTCNKSRIERPNLYYPINRPLTGEEVWPKETAVWKYGRDETQRLVEDGRLYWGADGRAEFPRVKLFLSEMGNVVPRSVWSYTDAGHTQEATTELKKLFPEGQVFDSPKPVRLIQRLISVVGLRSNDIVLDFFAGSATTGQAVMESSAELGMNIRFLLVQLPQPTAREDYLTIADVSKERLRRAGASIRQRYALTAPGVEIGFRVLKVDTSCMKDVYYAPDEVKQEDLLAHLDNIREDRTPEDLLFQVLVEWGVDLALPIATEQIEGKTVFFVDQNALAACFETNISEDLVKTVARRKPVRAVFRDRSYGSDSVKINVEQIFKLLSPSTEVKSL